MVQIFDAPTDWGDALRGSGNTIQSIGDLVGAYKKNEKKRQLFDLIGKQDPTLAALLQTQKPEDYGSLIGNYQKMKNPAQNLTPESKAYRTASGKDLNNQVNAIQDVLKTEDQLGRLKELAPEGVMWPLSSKAAEIDALGLGVLEPVIKIFNPRGAIATTKINLLKGAYSPTWYDTASVKEGKLAALERLQKQAFSYAQGLQALADQYGGASNIPFEVYDKYRAQGEQFLGREINAANKYAKENVKAEAQAKKEGRKAPSPAAKYRDPITGKSYTIPEDQLEAVLADHPNLVPVK